MLSISAIFDFLAVKFSVSNKICFSSNVKGDAIAKALIISSKLCFSRPFQLIMNPLFSKTDFRSLKINSKSENLNSSFFSSISLLNLLKSISHSLYFFSDLISLIISNLAIPLSSIRYLLSSVS